MSDDPNRQDAPSIPPDDAEEPSIPADLASLPAAETPPDADMPPEAPPAEDIPEWLQRLRARRATETASRQQRFPAAPPAPVGPPTAPPPDAADIRPGEVPAPPASAGPAPDLPLPPPGEEPPAWLRQMEQADAEAEPPPWLQAVLAEKMAHEQAAARPAEAAPAPDGGLAEEAAAPLSLRERAASLWGKRASLRQRRTQRRREKHLRSASVSAVQSLVIVTAAAILIATIFTFWTPASFLSDETREGLRPAYATLSAQAPPTPIPTPIWMRRVGIVSGHWGPHPSTGRSDPGAVCPDGLTEAQVNRSVAQLVVQSLSGRGYDVELLDEWDPRLEGYEASVLLSIHADSCHQFELPGANGFKVAPPVARTTARTDDARLVDCLITHYAEITGLPVHPSLTRDMTEYHSFSEISPITPAAIIELGFLYADRDMLENHPDILAQGIVSGLLCFLEAAPPTPLPEVTPWPTAIYTPTPLDTPGPS